MISRVHLVVFAALLAIGNGMLHGATPAPATGSVTGVVRDSAGVPQIGAQVQLLRPNLSVIASVFTDARGRFTIPSIAPGRYAVKAMGAWFLPSLREDVNIRSKTVVNLTLNSLYEVIQWLPAEPRTANAQKDDWAWTLRSAANRPLLRWLEDGPLVVASDGAGAHPKLKARILATGQEGTFGESGERISATVEDTPSNSRELLARVDVAPGSDVGLESMLGFSQELGFAGSVEAVAAVAFHPEMETAGADGVVEASFRSWETIHLGDTFEAEAGSDEVVARLSGPSPKTVTELLPFATAGWREGNSAIDYRITAQLAGAPEAEQSETRAWLPALSARNGALTIEHGLHQELGWERRTDLSDVAVTVFADRIDNPVIEAASGFAAGNSAAAAVLVDSTNGLLHAAGPRFTTTGMTASFEHRLPGGNRVRLSYANGDALVISATPLPATLAQVLAGVHPRRAQAYSLKLSGILDGSGTRWQASYRWQPEETVTQVAPFAVKATEPYFNLHVRQPICPSHNGTGGFNAVLDLRNLLAEGYRPYLLSDGSLLVFAQDQRSFRAGLAFNF